MCAITILFKIILCLWTRKMARWLEQFTVFIEEPSLIPITYIATQPSVIPVPRH